MGYQVFEGQHAHTIIPFGGNLSWPVYLLSFSLDMGGNDKINIHEYFTQSIESNSGPQSCYASLPCCPEINI